MAGREGMALPPFNRNLAGEYPCFGGREVLTQQRDGRWRYAFRAISDGLERCVISLVTYSTADAAHRDAVRHMQCELGRRLVPIVAPEYASEDAAA